jgi:hypothetical protein
VAARRAESPALVPLAHLARELSSTLITSLIQRASPSAYLRGAAAGVPGTRQARDEGDGGCPPTRRSREKDKDAENAKLKRAAWVSA